MPSQMRDVIWGAGAATGVLLVGSLLPIWRAWYFSSWEGVGYPATLWEALAQLPANARDVGSTSALCDLHLGNLIQGGILQVMALDIGVGGYRLAAARQPKRCVGPAMRMTAASETEPATTRVSPHGGEQDAERVAITERPRD